MMSQNNSENYEQVVAIATQIEALKNSEAPEVEPLLAEINHLADSGNLYAHYILANYRIFGRFPETFSFFKTYSESELTPYARLDSIQGFNHYVQSITATGDILEPFQVRAIYEMYMLICGESALFETFNIQNRPDSESHPLASLFSNKETLLLMLVELGHPDIYWDMACYLIEKGEPKEKIIEALKLAVSESVISKLRDNANLKLGEIYYHGLYAVDQDIQKAKYHWSLTPSPDRLIAKIVNQYLKMEDLESAKTLALSFENPKDVAHLFDAYPEFLDYLNNIELGSVLFEKAFAKSLKLPQSADVIRFDDIDVNVDTIFQEIAEFEDSLDQAQGTVADFDKTDEQESGSQEDGLDDDADDEQADDTHDDVQPKELSEEEKRQIEAAQNEIANSFSMDDDEDEGGDSSSNMYHDDDEDSDVLTEDDEFDVDFEDQETDFGDMEPDF